MWGLGISNYNKSPEDALRGVRTIQIELDDDVKGNFELRPAPGRSGVQYHQRIAFADVGITHPKRTVTARTRQVGTGPLYSSKSSILDDYETPELPRGALLRFVLHGTWGDPYYIGLDGLELRDADDCMITPERVNGLPDSVRVLGDDFRRDSRLPINLFCENGDSRAQPSPSRSATSWLAPNRISLLDSDFPGYPEENELYVCLHKPISLSAITVWNYSKNPTRGAKEMSVWIDGSLVARVRLRRADQEAGGQHILFTRERFNVIRRAPRRSDTEQDVLCIDENQVRIRSRTMFDTDVCAEGVFTSQMNDAERPATACVDDIIRRR